MSIGLKGIFNTAVQGMQAQSQHLNNISTNIANVGTTGYKSQQTHFATLLNHQDPISRSYFSVNTYDFRQVDKQGALLQTQRSFDVALNGRGLFVTSPDTTAQYVAGATDRFQYTRDGAFFGEARQLSEDTDGNGQLDRSEAVDQLADNFDRLDRNRDGMLSEQEIRKGLALAKMFGIKPKKDPRNYESKKPTEDES